MLTFFIDKNSATPLYEQLYLFIKEAIETKALLPNEKLPSKRVMAKHLEISVITVESSYAQLLAEGYIVSVPKKGFFVQEISYASQPKPSAIPDLKTYTKVNHYPYDFKTNVVEPEFFPSSIWSKLTRKTLASNQMELINITHPQGIYELRDQIAKHLNAFRGMHVSPEQIVITAGSEIITAYIVMLLGMDKVYGIETPGYPKIFDLFYGFSKYTKRVHLDTQGVMIKELEEKKIEVLHVAPSHQFPLAIIMPISRRLEILKWANEKQAYIIEDDYDSEFRFTGQPIPALQTLDHHERVIYCNSFAKTLTPSLRISYMVLPPHLLIRYRQNYGTFHCTVPSFDQFTLHQLIKEQHFERHIRKVKLLYKKRRDALIEGFESSVFSSFIQIIGKDAGLHFLLEITSTKYTETELQNMALSVGVRLIKVSEFYEQQQSPFLYPRFVIGYSSMNEMKLKEAISQLEKVWKF